MNIFRSLTALLSFGSALVPAKSIDVDAVKERHLRTRSLETPDGTTPATETECDQYKGQGGAYGLCNAYLKKDCNYSEDIKGCDKIQEKFEELTGRCIPGTEVIYTTHYNYNDIRGYGYSLGLINPSDSSANRDVGPFTPPAFYESLAIAPDGVLYTLIGGARLAEVNPSTGEVTQSRSNTVPYMSALAVDPNGDMYGVDLYYGDLYQIDKATGVATVPPIGNTGVSFMVDLAFDSAGTLYGTDTINIWIIDTDTGAATNPRSVVVIGTCDPVDDIFGIMFDRSDTLYATTYDLGSLLYTVDPGTMEATPVGNTGLTYAIGGAFVCE